MAQTRIVRKRFRLDELLADISNSSIDEAISPRWLKRQASWLRDELDPIVSQRGQEGLTPAQNMEVYNFLDRLRHSKIPIEHIRSSRIHLAISWIAGAATRWLASILGVADLLLAQWTLRYGPVADIGILLYEPGGRLHGICLPSDTGKEVLEVKWARAPGSRTATGFARQHGDLGFKPGDWWINSMFAFHAGILDSGVPTGRIIHDINGVYALLLNDHDEIDSPDAAQFTYATKISDPGRYMLTAATPASRQPIRILRSHSLRSFWAPRSGLRYEGLYKVNAWSVKQDSRTKVWSYHIRFRRLASESAMSEVLRRPLSDEMDDYAECKRIRHLQRLSQSATQRTNPNEVVRFPATTMKRANAPKFALTDTTAPTKRADGSSHKSRGRLLIDLPVVQLVHAPTSEGSKGALRSPAPLSPPHNGPKTPLLGVVGALAANILMATPSMTQVTMSPTIERTTAAQKSVDYFSLPPEGSVA